MSDANKAVFLSYASQDAEAAKKIADALRASGVEVWFDQSELVGGDAWDNKIRKQIKECALLIPIISANTQSRTEGYFRLEWRLADQRTHLMAKGRAFLLPVVIDDTRDTDAHVPDSFTEVQWTRLPKGEQAAAFAERVHQLLTGPGGEPARPRSIPAARPPNSRGVLLRAWIVLALVVGVVAYFVFKPRRSPEEVAKIVAEAQKLAAAVTPPPASAPVSEAQKLVARMQEIYDKGDDSSNDEWALAEELGEQATKLDPLNAEAWAAYSNVVSMPYIFGFDSSPERLARVTKAAERGMTLDPASIAARLALANCRRLDGPAMTADAEAIIRQLIAVAPDNWQVLRMAGNIFRAQEKFGEAIAYYDRAATASGNRPFVLHGKCRTLMGTGRFADAEAILDQLLAGNASPAAAVRKIGFQLYMHDDLDAAEAMLAQVSPAFLSREEGAEYASTLWLWRRNADQCVAALARFGGDTIHGVPKGMVSGSVYHAVQRESAARVEWQAALQKIEQTLAASPNNPDKLYWKAALVALLGRIPEAEKLLETCEQLHPLGKYKKGSLLLLLGRTEEALGLLEAAAAEPLRPLVAVFQLGDLRHDPAFDAIRSQPRFQAMLVKLEAVTPMLQRAALRAPAATDKSVAVLAFANLSDDKANEYFSDGISEELLNVLAKVPGLKVTARTSSFHFKGTNTAIPEIAQQLGVAYVVEGSVRKASDKVRITAQLIKGDGGFHVWSDTFTRDLKDVFAVQDEIAGLIANSLSLKMGVTAPRRAVDPEAYRLYLEALPAITLRTLEGFDRAEALINRAIERDPGLVPAQAALAVVWSLRAQQQLTISTDQPLTNRIVAQAEKALRQGPDWAEAQAACGLIYSLTFRLAEAEPLLRRAIQLNPSYAPAHLWLGRNLLGLGRMDEALVALKHATELDPLSHRALDNYAFTLVDAGRPQEALGFLEQALRIQPDSIQALAIKVRALADAGRLAEALPLAEQLPADLQGNEEYKIDVYGRANRRAQLEAMLAALSSPKAALDRFLVLLALGRHDEALAGLDQGTVDWGNVDTFLFYPTLDPVRRDPRFLAVLQARGLTEAHARAQAWRAAHPPQKPEAKK